MDTDVEFHEKETLKLTARGRLKSALRHRSPEHPRPSSRDETKKEIQEDDEATLRELLIRYNTLFNSYNQIFRYLFSFIFILVFYFYFIAKIVFVCYFLN